MNQWDNSHEGKLVIESFQKGFILADYRTPGEARYRGYHGEWVSAPIHVLRTFKTPDEAAKAVEKET